MTAKPKPSSALKCFLGIKSLVKADDDKIIYTFRWLFVQKLDYEEIRNHRNSQTDIAESLRGNIIWLLAAN